MKKHNIKPTQKNTNTNDIICTPDFIVDFLRLKSPYLKKIELFLCNSFCHKYLQKLVIPIP
nr:hypothetical protein [Moritella viscosa]SHO14616.1 Putative uncharacterized protein [Moritella viscosa]